MTLKRNGFWSIALLVVLAAGLSAQTPAQSGQTPAPAKPAAPAQPEKPTFRMQVDLVTNDVVVRDDKGNFVPDLKKDEFESCSRRFRKSSCTTATCSASCPAVLRLSQST